MRYNIDKIYFIEFKSNGQRLWKIDVENKDDEFIDGILYGCLFLLKQKPDHQVSFTYANHGDDKLYEAQINSVDYLCSMGSVIVKFHETLKPLNSRIYDLYQGYLNDPTEEGKVNLVWLNGPEFFHGLFMILDMIEMPYEQVVLHKPVQYTHHLNGVRQHNVEIQGLTASNLEAIISK